MASLRQSALRQARAAAPTVHVLATLVAMSCATGVDPEGPPNGVATSATSTTATGMTSSTTGGVGGDTSSTTSSGPGPSSSSSGAGTGGSGASGGAAVSSSSSSSAASSGAGGSGPIADCLGNIPANCPNCQTMNMSDKPKCMEYLQCYIDNDCNPNDPCGTNPDGVCGVNTIGGGNAPKDSAIQTFDCACP